jgi:hypothetical protein
MTLNGFRDELIVPLLTAVCDMLTAAELFGRSVLQLDLSRLTQVATLDDDGRSAEPPRLPLGGEITLPLEPDKASLHGLADRWRDDVARAAGYHRFRV